MGSMAARDMKEHCPNQYQLLEWHLQSNHYPPVSILFIPAAQMAIELATEEEYGVEIELPNGRIATVQNIMDDLHLWDFLMEDSPNDET